MAGADFLATTDAQVRVHDAEIAIKGAPEQHAEGANIPGDEDG